MQKPITVMREEYMDNIIKLTNETAMPAFVKIDVLDKIMSQLRRLMEDEYKNDKQFYDSNAEADEKAAASQEQDDAK